MKEFTFSNKDQSVIETLARILFPINRDVTDEFAAIRLLKMGDCLVAKGSEPDNWIGGVANFITKESDNRGINIVKLTLDRHGLMSSKFAQEIIQSELPKLKEKIQETNGIMLGLISFLID